MKIGTKSVLFGAHQFFIHPWFVAAAWWKLYGFPKQLPIWVAFFVHDLGYIGKPNMDGYEGEMHPEFGAKLMHLLFDPPGEWNWYEFTLYHSRFLAKKDGMLFSKLCVADKLAITMTPAWLYLPMVRLTGEIKEYMKLAEARTGSKYGSMKVSTHDEKKWFKDVQEYLRKWCELHKNGGPDHWTPDLEKAKGG